MIKAIDSEYCNDDLVVLTEKPDFCNLIISGEEIILFKLGDRIIIDKYENHPSGKLFLPGEKKEFKERFEYNKIYLSFKASRFGFGIHKKYFFKGSNRALYLNQSLQVDQRKISEETCEELSREELEGKIFNADIYDSMYVITRNGMVLFANNIEDGLVLGQSIIPTNGEIIELELRSRISDYNIIKSINKSFDTKENFEKAHKKKSIKEIKNFKIYGSSVFDKNSYSHMLLTSKDGKFNLRWFKLYFIEKDKFKFMTSPVPIFEPSVDDVLSYSSDHEIKYINDQTSETDFTGEVITMDTESPVRKSKGTQKTKIKRFPKLKRFFNPNSN